MCFGEDATPGGGGRLVLAAEADGAIRKSTTSYFVLRSLMKNHLPQKRRLPASVCLPRRPLLPCCLFLVSLLALQQLAAIRERSFRQMVNLDAVAPSLALLALLALLQTLTGWDIPGTCREGGQPAIGGPSRPPPLPLLVASTLF